MKIYQVHEYGGEWEDAYNYIIGSYLHKERAEEEKIKAEAKEEQLMEHCDRCNRCPFLEDEPFADIDKLKEKYFYYCDEAKLESDDYGITCKNYFCKWDKSSFRIEEVEVEE